MRQQRDFMRIWAGQIVSNLGDGVHRVAVLWWARQATGSNVIVVMVALASVLPTLVAAPLAGWLVDRMPRRRLMLASDVVRLATSAALAIALWTDVASTWLVIGVSAVSAAAAAVFDPALLASVTLLVPAEHRAQANSMLGISGAFAGILGPAVGGFTIGFFGTAAALWLDAATFAVSFALVALSRIPMPVRVEGSADDGSMAAGIRAVRANRDVRDLVVVAAGLNLCVAPVTVLIVGLAAGPLGLGGRGFGLLAAAIPAGIVGGFLIAPRLARGPRVALMALLATGGCLAIAGAAPWAWWAGIAFVLAGLGVGVVNTILPTRFQESVDPAVQGRVFSVVGALGSAGRPIGLLLAAPMMAVMGVRGAMAVCGIGLAAVAWAGRNGLAADHVPAAATGAVGDELASAACTLCP